MNFLKGCFTGVQERLSNPEELENKKLRKVKTEPVSLRDFVADFNRDDKHTSIFYEFKAITRKSSPGKIAPSSQLKENAKKNVSQSVLPYEQNIVCLRRLAGVPNSDYINASWVNGYESERAYIAAQGPTIKTIGDFWRMIVQTECHCIIVATNLFEHARQQCEKYWHNSHGRYDGIDVWLDVSYSTAEYTIRTFRMEWEGETRLIRQFQFQCWSESDNPNVGTILEIRRKMKLWMKKRSGPILVHCSTGTGRTGTYIAIDYLLNMCDNEQSISVINCVSELWSKRSFLVGTQDQYSFIYEVVHNYLICSNTVITAVGMEKHVDKLSQRNPNNPKLTFFEEEFKNVNSFVKSLSVGECAGGHRTENRWKSRYIMVQPPERARPYLLSLETNDSTDFINAVYIDGYRSNNQNIITQWPLKSTLNDLWRLINDHHVSVVAILNDCLNKRNYPRFWPECGEAFVRYGPVELQAQEEVIDSGEVYCRLVTMKNVASYKNTKVKKRPVVMLHLQSWPNKDVVPNSTEGISQILTLIDFWNTQLNPAGTSPTLIISKDGFNRAGLLCAIRICVDRLIAEGDIDVVRAVETVKRNRPCLVGNIKEYIYCYTCLVEIVRSRMTSSLNPLSSASLTPAHNQDINSRHLELFQSNIGVNIDLPSNQITSSSMTNSTYEEVDNFSSSRRKQKKT